MGFQWQICISLSATGCWFLLSQRTWCQDLSVEGARGTPEIGGSFLVLVSLSPRFLNHKGLRRYPHPTSRDSHSTSGPAGGSTFQKGASLAHCWAATQKVWPTPHTPLSSSAPWLCRAFWDSELFHEQLPHHPGGGFIVGLFFAKPQPTLPSSKSWLPPFQKGLHLSPIGGKHPALSPVWVQDISLARSRSFCWYSLF